MIADDARVQRLLVVTDLGPAGLAAVQAGVARAAQRAQRLAIVHTMPELRMSRPLWPNLVATDALLQATLPEQVRTALLRHATEAGAPEHAELFLEVGAVAESALAVAERWGADEILAANPSDGAIDTQRIVRHAQVPVYVVRSPTGTGPVIACTDFSDPSLPAIAAAADEARRIGVALKVMHVLEPIPLIAGIEGIGVLPTDDWAHVRRQSAEEQAARALAAAATDGDHTVVEGGVVPSILAATEACGASLLVIGTVGRTGVTRFLLGSVAEQLVQHAQCSLLVVRLHRNGAAAHVTGARS